jgi:hypothetical protein
VDQISGLRRQIEALMSPLGQSDGSAEGESQADKLARVISQDGRRQLSSLRSNQAISMNRPLLEMVAQTNPVQ